MLHVDGGVDVDAGTQQLLHVLPALGMPRAGGVGVGELVDQDEVGLARERGVEVELLEPGAAVIDRLARKHLQPFEQRGGLRASMGLDHPDHYVDACASSDLGCVEHGERLADPCRCAEEDVEPAPLRLCLLELQALEQLVRIGAHVGHWRCPRLEASMRSIRAWHAVQPHRPKRAGSDHDRSPAWRAERPDGASAPSRMTRSLSTRFLSMSTISKRKPSLSKRSPAWGMRPSCLIANPARVW